MRTVSNGVVRSTEPELASFVWAGSIVGTPTVGDTTCDLGAYSMRRAGGLLVGRAKEFVTGVFSNRACGEGEGWAEDTPIVRTARLVLEVEHAECCATVWAGLRASRFAGGNSTVPFGSRSIKRDGGIIRRRGNHGMHHGRRHIPRVGWKRARKEGSREIGGVIGNPRTPGSRSTRAGVIGGMAGIVTTTATALEPWSWRKLL